MNRRGFLGALTAVLASLGIVWPERRKTAETEALRDALHNGPKYADLEFRWVEEKVSFLREDNLYVSASAIDDLLIPSSPDRWQTGDVWLNLETGEPIYVKWTYPEGTVKVIRNTGGSPGASMGIKSTDRLQLVGSQGREFS